MNRYSDTAEAVMAMGAAVVAVAKKTKIAGELCAPLAERGVR